MYILHTRTMIISQARVTQLSRVSLGKGKQLFTSRIPGTRTRDQDLTKAEYATEVVEQKEIENAKPFTSVPGPLKLPLVGDLYAIPYFYYKYSNSNDSMKKKFDKYGPIYRDQYGASLKDSMVYLCDIEDFETLLRSDGMHPRRLVMESWREWRDFIGFSRGVLIQDGPDWKRMRVLLDRQMMRPQHVSSYTGGFGEVTVDFIDRLRQLRDPKTSAINKLDQELFHWSLESIGTVIYETRFGGLALNRSPRTEEFIQAIIDMFRTTYYLFYFPRKFNKIILPKILEKHENSWKIIFERGKEEIDNKFQDIKESVEKGEELSGFLSTILANGSMSMEEIYANISELMAAAVDTTSNSMQWVLYLLSRHPEIQETLRDEVLSVAPRGSVPTFDQLQRMPYLKGVLKESLRLYPVASALSRITDTDLVLQGYHIPPDISILACTYIVGRDPKYFPEPEKMIPERWIRGDERRNTNAFAWLSFGYGSRMCIGRRVAELEIKILTAVMMQEFEVVALEGENRPVTRPLLIPERPVLVALKDRQ